MSRILAIDPGYERSAYVVFENSHVIRKGTHDNGRLLVLLDGDEFADCACLYIEMVASYGMPVGKTVFETCVWIGRFIHAFGPHWEFVYRKDVKLHLCGTSRAKDGNVRQALIDLYGGDRKKAIGIKKAPGPLYGIAKDEWSALAVAVTAWQTGGQVCS